MQPDWTHLLKRAEYLLDRLETLLPSQRESADLNQAIAFRWQQSHGQGYLTAVENPQLPALTDLLCIDEQKREIVRNTAQFVAGRPANNVLLWGARGTGKSSIIRALLGEFHSQGLRLIEVDKDHLTDLPDIVAPLYGREERYILFCDDLSFEADEPHYKALKAVLDGSLSTPPDNVLIYATSNRRHLLPEYQEENLQSRVVGTEIHHGEAIEEKISLSDRFGMWLSFYPYSQDQYLAMVAHWLRNYGVDDNGVAKSRSAALRWALHRGNRSGRVAYQFARDWAGRTQA